MIAARFVIIYLRTEGKKYYAVIRKTFTAFIQFQQSQFVPFVFHVLKILKENILRTKIKVNQRETAAINVIFYRNF